MINKINGSPQTLIVVQLPPAPNNFTHIATGYEPCCNGRVRRAADPDVAPHDGGSCWDYCWTHVLRWVAWLLALGCCLALLCALLLCAPCCVLFCCVLFVVCSLRVLYVYIILVEA
ncbi:hypothetical protein V1517DRAFT_90150 [Lipomyces orientalis]|uniref:Uncharacterized protein n=1 Tax=Lipomyces orientalis TaxID=1233043 RepID=A0ACC3TD25_9ASCO